jgi:hypothetical protein
MRLLRQRESHALHNNTKVSTASSWLYRGFWRRQLGCSPHLAERLPLSDAERA